MVLEPIRPGPACMRPAPAAAFLSQLIAERQHLAAQRLRRRAPLEEALDAYAAGGRIDIRRLPAGFRRSIVA